MPGGGSDMRGGRGAGGGVGGGREESRGSCQVRQRGGGTTRAGESQSEWRAERAETERTLTKKTKQSQTNKTQRR